MKDLPVDGDAVDTVTTASRTLLAVVATSLDAAAKGTTIARYRALEVPAARGPRRVSGLAAVLGVSPSTAGRICGRLEHGDLVRRRRTLADRRVGRVSVIAAGRRVADRGSASLPAAHAGAAWALRRADAARPS